MQTEKLSIAKEFSDAWATFDEWASQNRRFFVTKSKRKDLYRSSVILGVLKFVAEHPQAFMRMYLDEMDEATKEILGLDTNQIEMVM